MIIEFEDSQENTLCDTIEQQEFRLGGLFRTELVVTEGVDEDAESNSKQITWMEEDEVQMYLRFASDNDRKIIWYVFKTRVSNTKRYMNNRSLLCQQYHDGRREMVGQPTYS